MMIGVQRLGWFKAGLVALWLAACCVLSAPLLAGVSIPTDVISGGGGQSQSASFVIQDTFGQVPIGPEASGASVNLYDGFWATIMAKGAAPDTLAPDDVSGFVATPGDATVKLRWANPSDVDFRATMIRYMTGSHPTRPDEGTPVENGAEGVFHNWPASADSFLHTGRTNGVAYYYTAFAFDAAPNYADGMHASATPADVAAPGPVALFTAKAGDGQISLAWTNPSDPDFYGTVIRYSTTSYPASHDAGTAVENGAGGLFTGMPDSAGAFVHTGRINGTKYWYSAFARDEVPNYSVKATADATPADVIAPDPVSGLTATANDDGSIDLEWTNPNTTDFVAALVKYSTTSYPAGHDQGTAVENGNDGKFPGRGLPISFMHTGLATGTTYYYSVFTYDEVPNYSTGVLAQATAQDLVAPALWVAIFQNPYITNHLDVFVIANEALIDSSLYCKIAGDEVDMALNDAPHNVWRGDYDLYSTGSLAINMCARDLSKNGSCINKNFVSSLMLASSGGTALSTDGACEVKMLGGVVKKDAYVLIFETASDVAEGGAGYEISPTALALGGFVEIGIAYAEEETEPEHLCLARLDDGQVSFVDSYLDRDASRVVAFVSRLGVCGLVRRSDALTPDYGAGGLRVFQNTPNPFVNSTVLTFEASRAGKACVDVVSVDGRVVRNLFSGMVGPGRHEVRWDGRDNGGRTAAGGVYLYKVEFDSKTTTRKMVNLR